MTRATALLAGVAILLILAYLRFSWEVAIRPTVVVEPPSCICPEPVLCTTEPAR